MHSVCRVLPFQLGALPLIRIRYLHKCVLHPSSVPAEEEWGEVVKLVLWIFVEICLCVPDSPALEAVYVF